MDVARLCHGCTSLFPMSAGLFHILSITGLYIIMMPQLMPWLPAAGLNLKDDSVTDNNKHAFSLSLVYTRCRKRRSRRRRFVVLLLDLCNK